MFTLRQSYRLCDCQAIHGAWIATGKEGNGSCLVFNVTVQGSHSWTLDIDVSVSMAKGCFSCIQREGVVVSMLIQQNILI